MNDKRGDRRLCRPHVHRRRALASAAPVAGNGVIWREFHHVSDFRHLKTQPRALNLGGMASRGMNPSSD